MKLSSLLSPSALGIQLCSQLCLILYSATLLESAIIFKKAPATNLDLGSLGRTAFAGDFTGISFYEYDGNKQSTLGKNGSQSLLLRIPDGRFTNVASSDAGIQAMCLFKMKDGNSSIVVVGGDFTDLGNIQSPGAALFNPETLAVQPLPGLSGQVRALLCDQSTNTVYAGGSFKTANSTNAVKLVGTDGWRDLPFLGFNGPVNSITKAVDGKIIFGGSFTGLGNGITGRNLPDQMVINLSDAKITAGSSNQIPGLSEPTNIICKTSGMDGPGDTWLLADRSPGFWRAEFGYTFQPTKLRLWNTHQGGRGTKTFRFTAFPINGIMNLTYIDPITQQNTYCTSECPLSDNSSLPYQDFHFANVIGMNGFQLDISGWYGEGGGFAGIEITHNDIDSFAVNAYNEPACAKTQTASAVTTTGPWSISPSAQSSSGYLSVTSATSELISIEFKPNIRQSGNYSVNMYTLGCIQDNTCENRGRVNITGIMKKDRNNEASFSTEIFQTNNYDKYDQIYFGYIDGSSSSFRPSVTITIAPGQNSRNLTVVAQRVGFTLVSPSGGLNGLFEYDPTHADSASASYSNPFDSFAADLPSEAEVNTLATVGETNYVGGDFSGNSFENIFKITNNKSQSLTGNGLNGPVQATLPIGTKLFVGGLFTNLALGGKPELSNIATYDTVTNTWFGLGAGVNGVVFDIVSLQINVTKNKPETTIALTGMFTQVLGFDKNPPFPVDGFAIWVPSTGNWLNNLDDPKIQIEGSLTTAIDLTGGVPLFAGSISSSQLSAVDVAEISSTGNSLQPFPIRIQRPVTSNLPRKSLSNHILSSPSPSEVITGHFYVRPSRNIVILGGHFSAAGPDGTEVNNLAFIDGTNGNTVTGVGPSLSNNSTILAMTVHRDTLFAGGSLTGTVNDASIGSLFSYNLLTSSFDTQPPSLDGDVYAITSRQLTSEVYVGGSFTSAGSLSCPAVCQYSTEISQWNRLGIGLSGVAYSILWSSPFSLIVGGKLILNDAAVSLVTFDIKSQNWSMVTGSNSIPGPVSSIAKANNDASQLWVSGYALNGTAFLMKFDGSSWTPISHLLGPNSHIKGLQVLSMSNNHAPSSLVSSGSILLVSGSLNLPSFGILSAVLFNGTSFQPYILTSSAGSPGSLSQFFAEKDVTFQVEGGRFAKGFVVLISLAMALGIIMIIVVSGLLVERLRKKKEGYTPAPTNNFQGGDTITSRVPPDQLFGSISQGGRKVIEKQATLI